MNLPITIVLLTILYTLVWLKGNANKLFNLELQPWEWWLYTGLISNYLGLISWWWLLDKYQIWGALAITYVLHTVVELGLSFYFFELPNSTQICGLLLLTIGGFLVLR
jgi:uncharacterized membrane protein